MLSALAALAACAGDPPAAPTPSATRTATSRQTLFLPSAPRDVRATAGDARATVTWQAPASVGRGALIDYTVTGAPGGATAVVPATATTATLAGLTNGTAYTFTVRARNGRGTGPASAPSAPVTPAAAPAPAPPAPTPPAPPPAPARWVLGYYVGYQRGLYPEASVDFTYMTHVVVGAVQGTAAGGVTTDFFLDNTSGPAMARTLAARARAAGRTSLLMLGGAGYRDALVAATADAVRPRFVANLLATVDALGFDGVDVDWEPVAEADKPRILLLLRELRAARPALVLTFPVGWVNANWGADPWYAQVAPLVDRLNIMSYDMAGNWGGWVSWHNAPLAGEAPNRPSSAASSVAAYRAAGVPAAKLGVGVGAYGACWRGATAPLQPLAAGAGVVASDNAMSYANILAQYYTPAAARWDDAARVPYLTFAAPAGPQQCTFVSYEDPRSVAEKAAFVAAQGLGGTIVWTVGQGHLPNEAPGRRDPLLRAAFTGVAP